ncbi:MAG: MFS transporter [Solirubrobacteraceae bacterium]
MSQSPPASQLHLDRRRRMVVLVICSMSLLLVGLDSTIVNVALPSIHRSLHASVSGLQWTIDAYTLTIASLLMLAGSTADRIGRKRVFQTGLIVFTLGSGLCALAPTLNALIAARVLQAIGASMLNPVAMSIIRNVFEDPRERAQAIGIWGAMIGISMSLGPVVGGALVDSAGWRWVFVINLPVGALALALTTLFVPESRSDRPRRLDPVGQVLVIAALASLTYAIIEGHSYGWTSIAILGLFSFSALAFVALVLYELRREEPLLEMRFFLSVPFSGASAIAVCTFAGLGGFLFLNTIYLQDVRHLSPFHAGLYTLPIAAMMLIFAPLSGRITGRRGARLPLVAAGVAQMISALLLIGLDSTTPAWLLFLSYLMFGVGFGLVNPPITNTAISGMPPAQAGVAAAVASTSRQVGQTLGVAVIGAVAGAGAANAFGPEFAAATHPGWWIIFGLSGVVLILGVVTTTNWALQTASATAARLMPARVQRTHEEPVTPIGAAG